MFCFFGTGYALEHVYMITVGVLNRNIRRALALIKHMQPKQQLVVKFFFFTFPALHWALVVLYVDRELVPYIMRRKALVFYYTDTDKSWPQHTQTAVSASGQKSGGNFYPQRSVYLTDKVGWEAMNIIFLDTSLLQISHLGTDTVNRWHSVLESGRWGRSCCSLV